jgi:hypothetical protein
LILLFDRQQLSYVDLRDKSPYQGGYGGDDDPAADVEETMARLKAHIGPRDRTITLDSAAIYGYAPALLEMEDADDGRTRIFHVAQLFTKWGIHVMALHPPEAVAMALDFCRDFDDEPGAHAAELRKRCLHPGIGQARPGSWANPLLVTSWDEAGQTKGGYAKPDAHYRTKKGNQRHDS